MLYKFRLELHEIFFITFTSYLLPIPLLMIFMIVTVTLLFIVMLIFLEQTSHKT